MGEVLEAVIREHHDRGDYNAALTTALEGYSREVMGFLYVHTGSETRAGDAYSLLAEDIWKGLETFSWRSSFRTWMYVLARNAAFRLAKKQPAPAVRLSEISELAQRIRTQTLTYLRTDAKDGLAALRESLDAEDQQLIVLRTKRNLSWNEVAAIMIGSDDIDSENVKRGAARYRQRYKTLKQRLKEQALDAGLLSKD